MEDRISGFSFSNIMKAIVLGLNGWKKEGNKWIEPYTRHRYSLETAWKIFEKEMVWNYERIFKRKKNNDEFKYKF